MVGWSAMGNSMGDEVDDFLPHLYAQGSWNPLPSAQSSVHGFASSLSTPPASEFTAGVHLVAPCGLDGPDTGFSSSRLSDHLLDGLYVLLFSSPHLYRNLVSFGRFCIKNDVTFS